MTPDQPTTEFVPLALYTALARLGTAMRRAQGAYFEAKRRCPHVNHAPEYRAARDAERRFDQACKEALAREQVPLPGMSDTGSPPAG